MGGGEAARALVEGQWETGTRMCMSGLGTRPTVGAETGIGGSTATKHLLQPGRDSGWPVSVLRASLLGSNMLGTPTLVKWLCGDTCCLLLCLRQKAATSTQLPQGLEHAVSKTQR